MASLSFSLELLTRLAQGTFRTPTGAAAALNFEPMPGGASLRRFVRVHAPESAGPKTAVGMFFPDAAPEEVTAGPSAARWPFLEVQDLLQTRGIRVPRLLAEDCPSGWILVEDFGDATLAAQLELTPELKPALYRTAVRDVAQAQLRLRDLPPSSVVANRSFTYELLLWEINHFREFGLEARGIALSANENDRFTRGAEYLARRVAGLPQSFVHRDYQSRNLMVLSVSTAEKAPELGWVDFQDALLGPRIYDLVALLNDSYQRFDADFRAARLREFAEHLQVPAELPQLSREFDWVTVQRKLKDAGRFVFIERKKGDASYLRFVQPTIETVFAALERLQDPELRDFEALLRARL